VQPKLRAFFLILFLCLCISGFFGAYSFSSARKFEYHKFSAPVLESYSVSSITSFNTARKSRVALIIDDAGESLELLKELAQLSFPVTVSILPGTQNDAESAGWAKRHGFEVMVHLPMEPESYPEKNPGENAVLMSMNQRKLREITLDLIEEIPYAVGDNNHMGSRFTQSGIKLNPVLDMIAAKELYFIDSRTTPYSVAFKMAQWKKIPSAERTLFIDEDPEEITDRFHELIELGRLNEGAIGIAHLKTSTLNALKEIDPADYRDVEFVLASKLCNAPSNW
jgi:polysaccharide deacetylase 2 family uncharacterized protein YibQ